MRRLEGIQVGYDMHQLVRRVVAGYIPSNDLRLWYG